MAEARGDQQSLGRCEVCGEGETYPLAATFVLPEGGVVPLLMRRCSHCKSEFAGHIEAAANQAVVLAVRGDAGAKSADRVGADPIAARVREAMGSIVRRLFPFATQKENAPLVDELVDAALQAQRKTKGE